ncbi:hypothetical protein CPB83DRAFT_862316 [Crepidotus variabilis]|uniref:F-box domain-containing protein n=1 Tax=Crepidotus variabilis TaxID=179855 RepID=A0A9P6E770_9AGAR|nr:hypothetical protein CPB83DRAFT_862316 [Crepidotus variabilis]
MYEITQRSDDLSRESVLNEIANTDRAIQQLYDRRLQLNEKLNLTAPIMKVLPLDILVEIFHLAVETQFRETFVSSGRVPFSLAMVCRSWKGIVLENSKIWSCILLVYDTRNEDRLLPLLETWLARSATFPLRIRLENLYGTSPNPGKGLETLLKESYRWSSFDSFYFPAMLTSEVSSNSFPCLKSLAIRAVPKFTWTIPRPIIMFRDAPILHFELTNLSVRSLALDFSRIKSLAGRWSVVELIETLRIMPLLRVCWVSVYSSTSTIHQMVEEPSLLLPQLEILRLEGHILAGVANFLSQITTPRLRVFRVEDRNTTHSSTSTWANLSCHLIQRSRCTLQALWIVSFTDIVGLPDVLRATPSIQQFTVQCRYPNFFNNALVDALELLPNLVELTLEGVIAFEPAKFIQAIRTRQYGQDQSGINTTPPRTLKTLSVKYTNSKWGVSYHPNVLRDFYRDMVDIEQSGTNFIFDCVDTIDFNQPLNLAF